MNRGEEVWNEEVPRGSVPGGCPGCRAPCPGGGGAGPVLHPRLLRVLRHGTLAGTCAIPAARAGRQAPSHRSAAQLTPPSAYSIASSGLIAAPSALAVASTSGPSSASRGRRYCSTTSLSGVESGIEVRSLSASAAPRSRAAR